MILHSMERLSHQFRSICCKVWMNLVSRNTHTLLEDIRASGEVLMAQEVNVEEVLTVEEADTIRRGAIIPTKTIIEKNSNSLETPPGEDISSLK